MNLRRSLCIGLVSSLETRLKVSVDFPIVGTHTYECAFSKIEPTVERLSLYLPQQWSHTNRCIRGCVLVLSTERGRKGSEWWDDRRARERGFIHSFIHSYILLYSASSVFCIDNKQTNERTMHKCSTLARHTPVCRTGSETLWVEK